MSDVIEENAQLLGFLYACPVGLAEMTSSGLIGMINPMAMQLLIPLVKTATLNFFDIMDAYAPELRNLVKEFSSLEGCICENHRILIHPEQGSGTCQKIYACTLVRLSADRFIISTTDISHQVQQERKLREAETWFSSLLDGMNDFAVASLDSKGHIQSVNASISKQTGFEPEDLIGQTLQIFAGAAADQESLDVDQQIALASRDGWYLNENWHKRRDGTSYWCQRLIAVRSEETADEDVTGYTVVLREGEPRAVDIHRLKQMLIRDHLTGTYNRMHFFEVAEKECSRKRRYDQPLSLIAIDIDAFKQVNDLHGHAAGDEVLRVFAQRCMSLLRPSDTMARIGGEEFVILLPSTRLSGAMQLAERLRATVSESPITVPGLELAISGSFGCAELPSGSCILSELMAAADKALYSAKNTGKNRVVSTQEVA